MPGGVRSSRTGLSVGRLIELFRIVQRLFRHIWFSSGSEEVKVPVEATSACTTSPAIEPRVGVPG